MSRAERKEELKPQIKNRLRRSRLRHSRSSSLPARRSPAGKNRRLKMTVSSCLAKLNHMSQAVLNELFGLEDGVARTVKEVANDLGRPPGEVLEIEADALRSLMGYGPLAVRPLKQ